MIIASAGILISESAGRTTYYLGPWDFVHERFPTQRAHIIGHTQGFWVLLAIGLLLGGLVYWLSKRGRAKAAQASSAAS
ncbi:MAG TPA: hypothetical protein VJH03_11615 [Blastocatellia bacterium]|nr:hypothetical protein [Blastocatellia bacterium]